MWLNYLSEKQVYMLTSKTRYHILKNCVQIDEGHIIQEGRTALLIACWRGYSDIVNELLSAGAQCNIQDQVHVYRALIV